MAMRLKYVVWVSDYINNMLDMESDYNENKV